MLNDMTRFAMERAVRICGSEDGTFSAACFSTAMSRITGVIHLMDGRTVAALMIGRPDVVALPGGSYYELKR